MTTKAEQETVIRWDQDERRVHLYTAYEPEMRKWVRLGYAVEVERTRAGTPSCAASHQQIIPATSRTNSFPRATRSLRSAKPPIFVMYRLVN